jgi:hypothetical protein
MKNLTHRPGRTSFAVVLLPLATLVSGASLLACSGDDTNPPVPDAGTAVDAGSDASKASDAAQGSETGTDSATPADSGSPADATNG